MIQLQLKSYNLKAQKGFVALLSAVIISVVLLLIATNLSLTGFYDRSNILDGELKQASSGFAEACVDTALLQVASNSGITNDSIDVDGVSGNDCTYSISGGGTNIEAQGIYNGKYYTNLEVDVNSTTLVVSRWEEVPN
ncbi:hypothetical protein A2738_01570 [Candidatus Nomurabacteria bacterium RIFCSPHIGHO2_01_FULL_42_15]|uniref:Type 4 fimbrial biogenesis protein PilX N-terminal domain-containing protein n=1 Tax=Candidatus Nomurabacteria bacterium RIFCSPHIGHO2_01_FULL_42_15 TaxID=1801742 RepID=A0A1F6VG43_9BACT|nr:MAG: hypothetical protein A2738_01570 [Candidatus Nomurabacteria bacterium RIFCSPHIGHO2_01_FULL_42_15]OGI93025.1 MAG: hypothetical protein A3A99_00600 [Candidatus Nomurabacteria bacterium RIFCSPLOWO2_01_FULL_41_18]